MEEFDGEMENLATATRKLLVDVIRVQPGETVHEVLTTPATPTQDEKHQTLMGKSIFSNASKKIISRVKEFHFLPLKEKKRQIQTNMDVLRRAGLVQDTMDYNSILNEVSKELRMKHQLREERRKEIAILRRATDDLSALSKELQGHIDQYKEYRGSSINNLVYQRSHHDGEVQRMRFAEDEMQYTAEELRRKGVIARSWGKCNKLKKEVLTVKLEGENVHVQLRNTHQLVPVMDLLDRYNSSHPIIELLHYDFDARLLLFLVYAKLFRTQSLIRAPAALPTDIRREQQPGTSFVTHQETPRYRKVMDEVRLYGSAAATVMRGLTKVCRKSPSCVR